MNYEEPETMKEIRRIREKQYEETKNMTPEERRVYDQAKSDEFMKKYGLNLKILSKTHK